MCWQYMQSEGVRGQQRWRRCNCQTICPYVGCTVRADESVGLTRPIKMSGGSRAWSAVANAPASPSSPDPLGLGGTVVKVNIDAM